MDKIIGIKQAETLIYSLDEKELLELIHLIKNIISAKKKNIVSAKKKHTNSRSKSVYMFGLSGELIDSAESITLMAIKSNIDRVRIKCSIKRLSVCNSRFYFSHSEKFHPPLRKSNHNPLYSKGKQRSAQ